MEEENNVEQTVPEQVPEVKSISEKITDFNKAIDKSIEDLNQWKSNLANIQEQFAEDMRKHSLSMKIQ